MRFVCEENKKKEHRSTQGKNTKKKNSSLTRDIIFLALIVLIWIMMSLSVMGDDPEIRVFISLIFIVPVVIQFRKVLRNKRGMTGLKYKQAESDREEETNNSAVESGDNYEEIEDMEKEIKKTTMNKKTLNLSPFEGAHDLKWAVIGAVLIFGIIVIFETISIIVTILFIFLLIYISIRLYGRLGNPWKKIHYPLMHRYSLIEGFYIGRKMREHGGVVPKASKNDFKLTFKELISSIYPDLNEENIYSFIENACNKFRCFRDEDELRKWFEENLQDKTEENIEKALKETKELFQKNDGFIIQAIIAEVIEKEYGVKERQHYIQDIIKGHAI